MSAALGVDLRHDRKIDVERLPDRRPLREIELQPDGQLGFALGGRLDHAGRQLLRARSFLGGRGDGRRAGRAWAAAAAPELSMAGAERRNGAEHQDSRGLHPPMITKYARRSQLERRQR